MFKASDILQKMRDSYERKIQNDSRLQKIREELQNGADQSTAQQYAIRSGELLSKTLKENITADLFDEGEPLDQGELANALIPMMNRNYDHVVAAASASQKYMNEQGGLGMKPVEPEFDSGAAMNIVSRMANYDTFEDAEWMLDEPIVTNSQHIADESLRENAEFQRDSGLKPKIVRTCESDACEWCQMLAGEYDIDEITGKDDPVYQRHNNCLCEITFVPGDGRAENISDQMVDIGDIDERIARSKEEAEESKQQREAEKEARIMMSGNKSDHIKERQRKEQRNISDGAINHVIKHPLNNPEDTLRYDKDGNPSVTYIGKKVVVIINPEDGTRITVRRPNKYERERWIKKNKLYY